MTQVYLFMWIIWMLKFVPYEVLVGVLYMHNVFWLIKVGLKLRWFQKGLNVILLSFCYDLEHTCGF